MFGEGGWCDQCGVPKHEQTGPIVIQNRGFTRVEGGWVPNWRFDVYCLEARLADVASRQFGVQLREVQWHVKSPGAAFQLVAPTSTAAWFDISKVDDVASPLPGFESTTCPRCDVTRWSAIELTNVLPYPAPGVITGDPAVIASREWFGGGMQSYRQFLWRRDFAAYLQRECSRDFKIQELR
jgi:hypothetical protein